MKNSSVKSGKLEQDRPHIQSDGKILLFVNNLAFVFIWHPKINGQIASTTRAKTKSSLPTNAEINIGHVSLLPYKIDFSEDNKDPYVSFWPTSPSKLKVRAQFSNQIQDFVSEDGCPDEILAVPGLNHEAMIKYKYDNISRYYKLAGYNVLRPTEVDNCTTFVLKTLNAGGFNNHYPISLSITPDSLWALLKESNDCIMFEKKVIVNQFMNRVENILAEQGAENLFYFISQYYLLFKSLPIEKQKIVNKVLSTKLIADIKFLTAEEKYNEAGQLYDLFVNSALLSKEKFLASNQCAVITKLLNQKSSNNFRPSFLDQRRISHSHISVSTSLLLASLLVVVGMMIQYYLSGCSTSNTNSNDLKP